MNTTEKVTTETLFDEIVEKCLALAEKKYADYGDSWKILRPSSLTDQIFIKAKRIRTIQETKENLVGDPIDSEFIGIVNYSLMGIYNLDHREHQEDMMLGFKRIIKDIRTLLLKKNHDYGEAWRDLRISSMTDLVLQKLFRLRQIETNNYRVSVSEQAKSSYEDIVNYSIFCLILIQEGSDPTK